MGVLHLQLGNSEKVCVNFASLRCEQLESSISWHRRCGFVPIASQSCDRPTSSFNRHRRCGFHSHLLTHGPHILRDVIGSHLHLMHTKDVGCSHILGDVGRLHPPSFHSHNLCWRCEKKHISFISCDFIHIFSENEDVKMWRYEVVILLYVSSIRGVSNVIPAFSS